MRLNEVFRALADPTRREILAILRRGELTAGELAERFPGLSKPTMSHHFAALKAVELVDTRRDGQQIWYSLNTTVAEDLAVLLWDMFSHEKPNGKEKQP